MGDETRDIDRLEQILDLIVAIRRRSAKLDRASFESDRDESDLAAFRLSLPRLLWNVISKDLHILERACRMELERLGS
jgi:hypothetical protein